VRPLIARYPDFLAGSAEFCDLQDALEPEVRALWEYRDSILDQLNVETATWGLKYWEQTLGITVDEGKDLAFRRSRIRAKLRGVGVTTVAMIQNVSESFSNGEVAVTEFADQFHLEIKFVGTLGIPPNMDDLTATLREIMPAHLQWDYIFIFNTHAVVGRYTHAQLSAFTHYQLKNDHLPEFVTYGTLGGYAHARLSLYTHSQLRNEFPADCVTNGSLSMNTHAQLAAYNHEQLRNEVLTND
jgi:hypothetical protein